MVPTTRRHVLRGALALGSLLAGCNGLDPAPTDQVPDTTEHVLRDPEHVMLRDPEVSPIVELSTPAETESDRFGDRPATGEIRDLIATRERANRLAIADVDGADEARRFVDETDFSAETLAIEPWRVGECYRRELCHVVWSEVEYETWYLETYRDADVRCAEGEHDGVVTLFRIPAVLDPETVDHDGTGTSRRGCREPRPRSTGGGET